MPGYAYAFAAWSSYLRFANEPGDSWDWSFHGARVVWQLRNGVN